MTIDLLGDPIDPTWAARPRSGLGDLKFHLKKARCCGRALPMHYKRRAESAGLSVDGVIFVWL
jgi:hypothetical protein